MEMEFPRVPLEMTPISLQYGVMETPYGIGGSVLD